MKSACNVSVNYSALQLILAEIEIEQEVLHDADLLGLGHVPVSQQPDLLAQDFCLRNYSCSAPWLRRNRLGERCQTISQASHQVFEQRNLHQHRCRSGRNEGPHA